MAVLRLFPPPTPSLTPIGVFVHITQVTNFVTSQGTWPVYDVTTEILDETNAQQINRDVVVTTSTTTQTTDTQTSNTTPTPTSTPTPTPDSQTQNKSEYDAILVGGLDYRSGDLNITQQEQLFKKGFGLNTTVKAFRHGTLVKDVLEFLKQNPKIPIFLFSKGCEKTLDLSRDINVDKKLLFVIEPYGISDPTRIGIEKAIEEGLPAENVYVGSYPGAGSTIKGNTSKNPPGIGGDLGTHWGALEYVASLKSNLAKN